MSRSKPTPEPSTPTELADRLHSAAIRLLRSVRRQDAESGIGPAQLSALSVLVFGGPLRLGALAEIEQVRPPTMTHIVAGLERAGFAARSKDPSDGRAALVRATAKGVRLLERARRRRVNELARRLARLSARDRRALTSAVALLRRVAR